MGEVLNLQPTIRRGGKDEEREDQVRTIWGVIIIKIPFSYKVLLWIYRIKKVWKK